MSVDALYEPGLARLVPPVRPLAEWAGRKAHAPPQSVSSQPTGMAGWMDRLSWSLGGSFVTCCLALSWVEYRRSTDGIDVNLVFDPDLLADCLVVSSGDPGGGARLQQRPVPGVTYVFDEADAGYSLLEAIQLVGAFFISSLAPDAVFRVVEVLPISQWSRRHGGFSDWLIELSEPSPRNRRSLVCRLTTHWADEGAVHLITNRFDLRSPVVFGVFRHRWEIASFLERVRLSPTQRLLLGQGRGLSPLRLFGTLLILWAWHRISQRVDRGRQEITATAAELQYSLLGLLPGGEMIRHPFDSSRDGTPASRLEQGLPASML